MMSMESHRKPSRSVSRQIEITFGIVTKPMLRRGNFISGEGLEQKLRAFIDYFNKTFAKPFRWTYTGRPVKAVNLKTP